MKRWALVIASILPAIACEEARTPRELSSGGVVEGTIRLAVGIELEPTRVANTTDPEICGEAHTLEDILLSDNRGIQNVIVSVRDAPLVAAQPAPLVLDNVDCRFAPHAAAVTAGSTIEAKNSDAVLHTTHLYGPKEINVSLPVQGAKSSTTLEQAGMYAVKCDVHGWMQAYIRVDGHPFHAVTDADGRFRIEGLPAGSYVLDVWHERLGPLEREFQLDASAPTSLEIEYAP